MESDILVPVCSIRLSAVFFRLKMYYLFIYGLTTLSDYQHMWR